MLSETVDGSVLPLYNMCYIVLHMSGDIVKTKPIGIRFEQQEYDKIAEFAWKSGRSFSDVIRAGAMAYVDPDAGRSYRSLAQLAESDDEDMSLSFGQFLDDFSHAHDKAALIAEEPKWSHDPGRWLYDFAATAHKLAHDNGLPVPKWVLADQYVAPVPLYAFGTEDPAFQDYLRKSTPCEFRWHNLFLGENILSRA